MESIVKKTIVMNGKNYYWMEHVWLALNLEEDHQMVKIV